MKNKTPAVRQGDILILPVKSIPPTATQAAPTNGRLVVALGEATGHHHSFHHRPGITMFRDDGAGGALYLKTTEPVPLEHQEHTALVIQPGTYRVVNQRVAVSGLVRRVVD